MCPACTADFIAVQDGKIFSLQENKHPHFPL